MKTAPIIDRGGFFVALLEIRLDNCPMKKAMEELHFHPRWFEIQLLPKEFFVQLLEKLHKDKAADEDSWQCLEHYRYSAFRTILTNYTELTEKQIHQYLELCDLDEDTAMASAARIDLLLWGGLSPQQYLELTHHPIYATEIAQKLIRRKTVSEALQVEIVSDELFSLVRSLQDFALERELVEHPGISLEQLVVLFEQGQSRRVRNMARNRLGRKFLVNRRTE